MARLELPPPNRFDRLINGLFPQWGARRQHARTEMAVEKLRFEMSTSFYRGADYSRLLSGWLTEPQTLGLVNPNFWERETLQVRSQELNRNNPVASSITDTLVTNVIGQGLQPRSSLRNQELGISKEKAKELRRQAENIYDRWQKQEKFRIKQALAFRKIVEDGEIITNLPSRPGPRRIIERRVELIEANRLGTPLGKLNVFDGIEMEPETKEPMAYWLRKANITTSNYEIPQFDWYRLPAQDSQGRPLLLHNFLLKRPGQLRGIPFFASALTYFKHLSDYFSASVVAAKLAACVALVITSTNPLGDTLAAQTVGQPGGAGQSPYQGAGGGLEQWEPASILRLANGESATMIDPKGVHESFAHFMEAGLRIVGAASGLPYELLIKDFSKTNYSSARAALQEARRWFMFLRSWFSWEHCQPIYELVLEEAYLAGEFQAPHFYENRDEYCRCQWNGGAWGWVDPVKEVASSIAAIDGGLSTYAKELAGLGEDWEETFEQAVREKDYAKALGLTFSSPQTPTQAGQYAEATDEQKGVPQGEAISPIPNAPSILASLAQIASFSRED